MVQRNKKLMTISIDERSQNLFKENCKRYGLKMSQILQKSMETFNDIVKQKEMNEKEEQGNE